MIRVSVVMAVYNGAKHLATTVDSILAQTQSEIEIVIVDDGSKDQTPRVLFDLARGDGRIRVLTLPNVGLTRALIAGCAEARAPLIARHDAGDLSHPERLSKQIALFKRWPELVFASCAVDFIGPEDEYLDASRDGMAFTPMRILALKHIPPILDGPSHHGSAMFQREAYERIGGYRPYG